MYIINKDIKEIIKNKVIYALSKDNRLFETVLPERQ